MNILQALENLDPKVDAHWTANDLPRLDVLRALTNNDALSRQEVIDASPQFTRQTEVGGSDEVKPETVTHGDMSGDAIGVEAEGGSDEVKPERGDIEPGTETVVEPSAEVMVEAEEPSAETLDDPIGDEEIEKADEDFDGDPIPKEVLPPVPMTELEKLQSLAKGKEAELIEVQKHADAAKLHSDRLSNEVTAINAEISARTPWDRHAQTSGIKAYIASQNELRLQRADRMNKFIQATGGSTPGQLRKALDARSALDVAMAGRKPARGARRPEVRVPVKASG